MPKFRKKLIPNDFTLPKDFFSAGIHAGIKKKGLPDLGGIISLEKSATAGLFTSSGFTGHSIDICRKQLKKNRYYYGVLVSSGNSNTATGKEGYRDSVNMLSGLSSAAGKSLGQKISKSDLLISHTGVIGKRLPIKKILKSIPGLAENILGKIHSQKGKNPSDQKDFAKAIMTTDTRPKGARVTVTQGDSFSISGVAKGAGMIAPNMATFLCYLTTDARVNPPQLQKCLKEAVDLSFNRLTIDGDMSPDDSVIMMANGSSNIKMGLENIKIFQESLNELTLYLAREILLDGEGTTKVIKINVQGAKNNEGARIAALAISNSMLVKTAFFGEDANWGRVLTALGYSGAIFNLSKVNLFFGPHQVCRNGQGVKFSESEVKKYLENSEIDLNLDLGLGRGSYFIYTTDLTYEYVKINADYRT